MTAAISSLVTSTIAATTASLIQGLVVPASTFGLQHGVVCWRMAHPSPMNPMDNEPLLLMDVVQALGASFLLHDVRGKA